MNDWHSAEQHAQRAHEFFEAGQWEKALAELQRAIEINPYEGDWHFGLGLTFEALERFDEAADSFEKVIGLRGEDVDTLLHLGADLVRSGKSERAIEVFDRVHQLDPECEAAYCQRIAACVQLDRHDDAEVAFYLARQITDECPVCFDNLAHSLYMRGELERAIWCWQEALKLEPDYPAELHGAIARCYWHRGQLEQARQSFIQQMRQSPGDIQTLLQLAALLTAMGRNQESAEKYRRVIEAEPTNAEAHLGLGELALIGNQLDTARAELEIARQLEPNRPGVNLQLAQLAQRHGDSQQARELLNQEVQTRGHGPDLLLQIARVQLELHMPQAAFTLMTELIQRMAREKHAPPEAMGAAYRHRGHALLMMGDYRQAVLDARRCLRLTPNNMVALQVLVLAHLELRKFARATLFLEKLTKISGRDSHARYLRRRLRRAMWAHHLGSCARSILRTVGWQAGREQIA